MCFSATASFAAASMIGVIGVATLRHVREPRTMLFAAVPLLFAVHQFVECFVWLGLDGQISALALDHVSFLFMIYAQGILPLLMPAAVLLLERSGSRRRAILILTGLGALVCARDLYGLVFFPSQVLTEQNSIAYRNPITGELWISCLYILATCGALILSSHRVVRAYGVVNIVVLTIVEIVKESAFASVWCFYAAIMSVIIYWQFRTVTIDIQAPNSVSPPRRPFLFPWLHRSGGAAAAPAP